MKRHLFSHVSDPAVSGDVLLRKLRKDRGVTLVEVLAGLGIFALVIVGATSLYNVSANQQKSNSLSSGLNGVTTALRNLYSNQANFSGLGTTPVTTGAGVQQLITANKVPSNWAVSGATGPIVHPFNGNVAITSVSAGANFVIGLSAIPQSACVDLLSTQSGITGYGVNTAIGTLPTLTAASTVTPADAATACANDTNVVWLRYR